jgi:hypothetical protein
MTTARRLALVGVAFVLMSGAAAWAAEMGRVQFQGKTVILSDDGTWRFDETAPQTSASGPTDCADGVKIDSKSLPVSLCFSSSVWERDTPTGAWEFMFRNKAGTLYGGLISETIALDESFLRNAIVQNAAGFAKIDVSKVKIGIEEKVDINGRSWNHIIYGVPIGGTDFTFSNYYMTVPNKGMVQVVFFSPDANFAAVLPDIEKAVSSLTFQ